MIEFMKIVVICITLLYFYNATTVASEYLLFGYDKDCFGNDISLHSDTSLAYCKQLCDESIECVGILYISTNSYCAVKYQCSTADISAKENYAVYLKTYIEGWSLSTNSDCFGNDISTENLSPAECVRLCIVNSLCQGVVLRISNLVCNIKYWCEDVQDLEGYYTYRMLDKDLRGFTRHEGKDCSSAYSLVSSVPYNAQPYTAIYYTWQCAALCIRLNCDALVTTSSGECWLMTSDCQYSTLSDGTTNTVYIKDSDNLDGYTEYANTYCSAPTVVDKYPNVPIPEQCLSVCDNRFGCANVLYEIYTQTCYILGQCEQYYQNSSVTLYAKSNRALTECWWSNTDILYVGHVNTTISGKICQRWDTQTPFSHSFTTVDDFADNVSSVSDIKNYCRSQIGTPRPWCYTGDPSTRWEFCDVPVCMQEIHECQWSRKGKDYTGTESTTINGNTCQRWEFEYPQAHGIGEQSFTDIVDDISELENYCRNPDDEPGPWCYTTDGPRWELCPVSECEVVPSSCKVTVRGEEYLGRVSQTVSGHTCQRWDQQTPHSHSRTADMFPDKVTNISWVENFCRNFPLDDAGGPYCYTTDPDVRWEECLVEMCQDTPGGYGYLPEHVCSDTGNDIAHDSTTNVAKCQALCDITYNCVVFELSPSCNLNSACQLTGGQSTSFNAYVKYDFPGWSLSVDVDYPGNDIISAYAQTASDCIDKCIEHVSCGAVGYRIWDRGCWLKYYGYSVKLRNYIGLNVYRILDREMAGYTKYEGQEMEGYEIFSGRIVQELWQCAAFCRKARCKGFVAKFDTTNSNYVCNAKYYVTESLFIAADEEGYITSLYKVTAFSPSGVSQIDDTWCEGGDTIENELRGVPSSAECGVACEQRGYCLNSVYDRLTHVCYIKGLCTSRVSSVHHTLYSKTAWTEWSEYGVCDNIQWTHTRSRVCIGDEICDGDMEETAYCYPEIGHTQVTRLSGLRLEDHVIETLTTSTLRLCLLRCQTVHICTSVNVRNAVAGGEALCELNSALEDTSMLNSFLKVHPHSHFYVIR